MISATPAATFSGEVQPGTSGFSLDTHKQPETTELILRLLGTIKDETSLMHVAAECRQLNEQV